MGFSTELMKANKDSSDIVMYRDVQDLDLVGVFCLRPMVFRLHLPQN